MLRILLQEYYSKSKEKLGQKYNIVNYKIVLRQILKYIY